MFLVSRKAVAMLRRLAHQHCKPDKSGKPPRTNVASDNKRSLRQQTYVRSLLQQT